MGSDTIGTVLSFVWDVLKAGLPHLLALLIAVFAGWWVYKRGQMQRLDRLLAALLIDSAQNLTLLRAAIERERWRAESIDLRFADPSVAQALCADASSVANLVREIARRY